ncbi:N-acetylmuramoyl-L-alanine amidase [bacterium]|nr:N-acetylmuramoyl-L-alanine amidase [bacterium]
MKRLLFLLLIFSFFTNAFGQTIQLNVKGSENFNSGIRAFIDKNVSFVSVGELREKLKLDGKTDAKAKTSSFIFEGKNLSFTANSTFFVVGEKTYHLPIATLWSKDDVCVPFRALVDLLDEQIFPKKFDYTREPNFTLTVTKIDFSPEGYNVLSLRFEEKANGTLIRIRTTKNFHTKNVQSWIQKLDGWLYLTVFEGRLDRRNFPISQKPDFVKEIKIEQKKETAQIGFEMKKDFEQPEISQSENPCEILISLRHTKTEAKPSSKSDGEELLKKKNLWKIDTIVLDAGHGGKDPGAIGKNKTQEKDVCLAVVLKLGKLIEESLGIKVVYTRKTDIFIPLHERGKIANVANGKLFISIHANSSKNSESSGLETYFLSSSKSEAATKIAERENEVINLEDDQSEYQDFDNANFIVASMMQSEFAKESEKIAGKIQEALEKKFKIKTRGVKQAGFLVLWRTSMPSILVETGFVTNAEEEAKLNNPKHQQKIAEAILNGIKTLLEKNEEL